MATDEITQVQLTEDGSRPVDLPTQFATIGDMVKSYTELQGAHTKLTQANAEQTPKPVEPAPTKTKKVEIPVEVESALQNIATFNEGQRKLRFEELVGSDGLLALETYITGDAIDSGIKAAYEAALDSGNEALIDANFALIRQIFEVTHGAFQPPESLVTGVAASGVMIPSGTKQFNSLSEQLTAQKDLKYKTDPAFRREVEQRIAISGPYSV